MSFARVVHKAWEGNHLFSALVELTYRCNLDCFFCYNDLGLEGRPLSKQQYFDFLEGLRNLGTLNVVLSGGEPLAHPDFFEIGARARELGFVIRVKSNGHALRGEIARRLKSEVDPFVVETSLHGASAATHDRQTRVDGSFDRLIENIREVQSLGLRIKLNSTLTAWNEDEFEAMIALATDLGLRLQIDPEVTPRDDGDTEPQSIRASRAGVLRMFEYQAREAERSAAEARALTIEREGDDLLPDRIESSKHCGAGSATLAVDPFGSVYPCVQWRRAVGSLHQSSIEEIWLGSSDLGDVRQTTEEVKSMLAEQGPYGSMMSFCPGNATSQTGNPLGLYPAASARKHLREEATAQAGSGLLPIVD